MYGSSILKGHSYQTGPNSSIADGAAIMPTVREEDLLSTHVPADYMRELTRAIKGEAGKQRVAARATVEQTRDRFIAGTPDELRAALAKFATADPLDLTLNKRAQLSGMLDAADHHRLFPIPREPQRADWDNGALFASKEMSEGIGPILSRLRLRLEGVEGAARDAKLTSNIDRDISTWTLRDAADVRAITEDVTRLGGPMPDQHWALNEAPRLEVWPPDTARLDDLVFHRNSNPDRTIAALRG